ncbi:MAG: nicotinate (nicotinamide) nucleotide adenylyltransferase [Lachnospiraceae bacterium]|nr:nicotinate (nicotinamide) nucleotide adenylyltransferase [Lachnospiraceae bacterium]
METKKRMGIFGGSFDPIHRAHQKLAKQALEQFLLDEVWFVPSGVSYHKGNEMTSAHHRVQMIKRAIRNEEKFFFSDLDIARSGNTYTADTLAFLKEQKPDTELFFIAGADSLLNMENWYRPEAIFTAARILVAKRPGSPERELLIKAEELKEKFGARIDWIEGLYEDVSSRQIREAVQRGESLSDYVIPEVERYIREHELYRDQPKTPEEIRKDLEKRLNPHRFAHTLGVARTAEELAAAYGADGEKAYLAGLLHDCAKDIPDKDQIHRAKMAGLTLSEQELLSPALIHAKLGAYYARERYGVRDEEILNAIRYHTTGRPAMTLLETILYIADYIEPGRENAPRLPELRHKAQGAREEVVCRIAEDTLEYLERCGAIIDNVSRETAEYYKRFMTDERNDGIQ